MKPIGELWGSLRGILRNRTTFTEIKDLVGAAGLPVQELAHIQQKQRGGASKGQLMEGIDGLVNKLDDEQCNQFVATCTRELLSRYGHLRDEVEAAFRQHGWGINDAHEIIHVVSDGSQNIAPTEIKPKKGKRFLFSFLEWYHRLNIRVPIVVAIITFLGTCVLATAYIISAYIQSSAPSGSRHSSSLSTNGSIVDGDMVGRDKLSIYMPPVSKTVDEKTQFKVAKVKIDRIIEDLSAILEETRKEYLKESDKVASNFSSRNMFTSGIFIKAQKELAINTKEKIEKIFTKAHRDIQDITLENFEAINLDDMPEFAEEKQALLEIEQNKALKIYTLFEHVVKSWEMKALGTTELTKDFKL